MSFSIQSRSNMKWLCAILVSFCLGGAVFSTHAAPPVTVTFYHTSDLHDTSKNIPRIAEYVRVQKEKYPNVLFLDTGDWFNKGDLSRLNTRGEAITALMGACGYDAIITGNHDYSFGTKRLVELVDRFSLPLLAVNCVWPETVKPQHVAPYRLFEFDGVDVAVIGTACPIRNHSKDKLLELLPIIPPVRSIVEKIQGQADIIVVMTHHGTPKDMELAQAVPRIDLIVGGHDHRIFNTMVYDEETRTVVPHSGRNGNYIGKIVLVWDGEKIVDRKTEIIPITPEMPPSPKVETIRQKYLSATPVGNQQTTEN